MKIVHIITRLIVGGAQENTLLSCEGQHDAGHDVTLITGPPIGPEGSLMTRATEYGYKVEMLDAMRRSILPFKDCSTYQLIRKRLIELKPDVVHTHSSKAGIIGRWAAHRAQVPKIIHTIHGLAFTTSTHPMVNGFYKWTERKTAPITHKIISVADAMTRTSLENGIGKPDQYITIHSGMDLEPFLNPPIARYAMRRDLGLYESDIAVGTIARLFHLKGHNDLIELAPKLCAEFPRLKFVWIGDGILRSDFEKRIEAMKLKHRFNFTGLVSPQKIPELVNALDIVAHPSRREGLARAIPQGQLARCPVVCYDIDGNSEGLIDGKTGFAIKPFDIRAFGNALAELLSNDEKRKQMGEAGRTFAASIFDANVMVRKLLAVYAD